MLQVDAKIPAVTVWHGPNDPETLTDIVAEGPCLFVFYLFDWSST
jgi:hypothetical protein